MRLIPISFCLAPWFCLPIAAQDAPATPASGGQADAPFVLRETTNEVVLDVVARDKRGNPVNDLAQNEFQVFDASKGADKNPKHILSMKVVDPHKVDEQSGGGENGFKVRSGANCALSFTTHYQLAITAASSAGYHPVLIKSTRPGITLSYRRHYYVGATVNTASGNDRKGTNENMALGDAACFHTLFPPTLEVTAHPVPVPGGKSTRYEVVVRPESLAGIGLDGNNMKVNLDFGMCTFDASGDLGQYFSTSSERTLTPAEMDRAQSRGFSTQLDVPSDGVFLVRLVVREHSTGNMGIVDVSRPVSLDGSADGPKFVPPPVGTIRAFGVATPLPNAFCGDVYEISEGAAVLPDFWNLDPVGSLYTNALNVQEQDLLPGVPGIPGVTRSLKWFGIDYYGEFYVTKPGEYKFDLESDDGSRLFIDNQQVIDNDAMQPATARNGKITLAVGLHTIHVPYFQGSPPGVALILAVKPPGGPNRPFNLNDYPVPAAAAAQ